MGDILGDLTLTPVPVPPAGEPFDGLPVVTHQGVLAVGGHELRVYQLSDGRRVVAADDVHRFFGIEG
jgi:hypothetical protein